MAAILLSGGWVTWYLCPIRPCPSHPVCLFIPRANILPWLMCATLSLCRYRGHVKKKTCKLWFSYTPQYTNVTTLCPHLWWLSQHAFVPVHSGVVPIRGNACCVCIPDPAKQFCFKGWLILLPWHTCGPWCGVKGSDRFLKRWCRLHACFWPPAGQPLPS